MSRKLVWCAFLTGAVLLPYLASGQTLNITSGVRKFGALTNTTVTMTGRCELWVTNSATPLSGCTINLNSADAFLVLPGVRPSAVVSTYLSQVRINGAPAAADSNCRVVQYAMGAVVVPHAPSLQPLQVFSGPYYSGSSTRLGQWVYYKGTALGAFNANIRSFKLKRGYAVTLAQFEDGTGTSRNYVAQDGDLEVSILPTDFDDSVRFVYIVPWRWTSKKGIASDPGIPLINVRWWYNWNIDQNSSRDFEYVAIRQNQFWPPLDQNWQSRGVNTLLGYNEPDRPDQANMSVGTAISAWRDLLGTGLRVGAPAVSDGGRSGWLYPFIDQADAANLRVDFVPVHFYWCFNPADAAGAANQFYNFLKATYDQVKRPLWITEWNNGANWTGCGDPTYAQQGACINAMIDMLDNTPWVERYSLYNWVETVRYVVTNGVVTPAGAAYRDQQSPVGYVQAMQDNNARSYCQLRFENDTLDSSGYGNNGITSGSPAYTNGYRGQALVFDGANTVVALPPNVARGGSFTFAARVNWTGGGNWQRIFDFGNSVTHYMFLTPRSSSGNLRFAIRNGGSEQIVQTSALAAGSWQHVAVTLSGNTARLYVNGVEAAVNSSMSITPANFDPVVNYLGKSQFINDPLFNGLMDDVLITDTALTAAEIAAMQTNTPPQFANTLLARGSAVEGMSYSNSIAGAATDADPGDTLSYVKTSGPDWLNVAQDGTLTGTPTLADPGTNYFVVRVVDEGKQNAYAVVTITVVGASGVWIADISASWGDTNRWSSNIVATGVGETADFSTIDITADRTVTLDRSRSIGVLKFADTVGGDSWTIAGTAGSVLSLNNGLVTQPAILVSNTVTISAALSGDNGFIKSGPGTLILTGNDSYTGGVIVNAGTLLLHGTNASATTIEARNGTLVGGTGSSAPLTIRFGAELSPGPQPNATLTTEGLILNSGSTLTIDLDVIGDRILVNGNVALNGTLNVRPSGTVVNGAYTIIRYAGTRTGALIFTNVPQGYSMALDYSTSGEVRLLVSGGLERSPILFAGSVWKYNAAGADLGTSWRSNSFDDSSWLSGPTQIGYGDDDEATPIDITAGKPQIIYFRKAFTLTEADIGAMSNSMLSLLRDDGAVVYLNGAEVRRDNLPAPPAVIAYDTRALVSVVDADENAYFVSGLDPGLFVVGANLLAVEVHQEDPTSTDISFDLKLEGLVQGSSAPGQFVPVSLLRSGALWKYFDGANDLGTAWRSNSFNDFAWRSGPSMLGFGDANGILPATVVASNQQWTTYFRRAIYVPDASQVQTVNGRILRDDAAVVYINGAEVWRDPNLPAAGSISYSTPATDGLGGADESTWLEFSLDPAALQTGTNAIAIEVHQNAVNSSDLAMNFELSGMLLLPLDVRLSIAGDAVSWPGEAGWFSLVTTTNLSPPIAWTAATNTAVLSRSNGQWRLTLPAPTNGQRYFRLQNQ